MKTALLNRTGKMTEKVSFLRVIAPALTQEQDDRMRQIIREELSRVHTPAPIHPPKQPSLKTKEASLITVPFSLVFIGSFSDELQKIKMAQLTMNSIATKPTISTPFKAPRNTMSIKAPTYSQVNPASQPGPAPMHQPTLSPPDVRG